MMLPNLLPGSRLMTLNGSRDRWSMRRETAR